MSSLTTSSEGVVLLPIRWGARNVVATLVRTQRSVLKIEIEPTGRVIIHAPQNGSIDEVAFRASRRGAWIFRQLDRIEALPVVTPKRRYVSGETHLYLGKQYRLAIETSEEPEVRIDGTRLMIAARDPNDQAHCRRLLTAFYKLHARTVFRERLSAMLAPFERKGLKRPYLVTRWLSKRWGSFTPKGRIVLNIDLIRAAPNLIDYVICHELAHAFYPDHGSEWHALLDTVMPDWELRKQALESTLR